MVNLYKHQQAARNVAITMLSYNIQLEYAKGLFNSLKPGDTWKRRWS